MMWWAPAFRFDISIGKRWPAAVRAKVGRQMCDASDEWTPKQSSFQSRISHLQSFNTPRMEASVPYTVQPFPGRGMGLKAARDIKAGEVVLPDLPIVLTSAGPADFCTACLRTLLAQGVSHALQITDRMNFIACRMRITAMCPLHQWSRA